MICVPLKAKGRVFAVIQAINRVPGDGGVIAVLEATVSPTSLAHHFISFTADDLEVLKALALTAGGVIFKLQLQDRMVVLASCLSTPLCRCGCGCGRRCAAACGTPCVRFCMCLVLLLYVLCNGVCVGTWCTYLRVLCDGVCVRVVVWRSVCANVRTWLRVRACVCL